MDVLVLHVVNRRGLGGAEGQLSEIVRRSVLSNEVIELGSERGGRPWRPVARVAEAMRQMRPDVVVAWLDRPQIATAACGMPSRVPLVAAVRGFPRRTGGDAWLLRAALSRFDALVTNSAEALDAVATFIRPFRLPHAHVIPNGVSIPDGSLPRRDRKRPARVVFIGRDNHAKGVDVLLAALSQFERRELEAVLIGQGLRQAAARSRLSIDYTALDLTPDPWAAAGDVDLLVLSSRTEGSPNVVLEAFARGVPVVGTHSGGTISLLSGGRGLLVPPEAPDELARAIRAVASEPKAAAERAARALAYVRSAHAWPRVVGAYDHLFRTLARGV
jgi:glycosyltransferase involved in cell wall biosynthesis